MKHIIILGDGMADHPVERLGGKTLLQYAHTPVMDLLAKEGRCGRLLTVPEGFSPGSEVANTCILGYDLHKVYEGRGPLEAASIGYDMQPDDLAMRCNIITLADGKIKNHHGGHLTTEQGDVLIKYLNHHLDKINSALPQCYYAKQEGTTNVTTETGAGQWGAALSYAAKIYGLDCAVYQVKITMQQKPYRSSVMRTFGAAVTASPSMSTRAGKDILTKDPTHSGSLGTAISEAVELATTTPNCKYVLGSVLNHVGLHQTIIGLEAEKQMQMAGEYPDIVIGCFGGGSNFGGIAFPFMRHNLSGERHTEFIAAEPDSCPKLTRGQFRYDFGDEAGYTPLLPMFTLGHNFKPSNIHAGGLRYHGAGMIISQLIKDGLMHGVDIPQLETFEAGMLFAQTEGIIPAPESCHAIAATIREANKCKETGEEKVILFNLSGHGLIDMPSYESFIKGDLQNYTVTDEMIAENLAELDK